MADIVSINKIIDDNYISHDGTKLNELLTSSTIDLELKDGYSYTYSSDAPHATKNGNIVHLTGLVTASTTAEEIICTLPTGYRPARGVYNRYACAFGSGTSSVIVQVRTNGNVTIPYKDTETSYSNISLSSISFSIK